jgi:mono/diheme cytochrome c family protein
MRAFDEASGQSTSAVRVLVGALVVGFAVIVAVVGQSGKAYAADNAGVSKVAITDKARAQANDIYESRCESCHGPQGNGDGPGAMALGTKPQNFKNRKWQKSVTDKQIAQVIVNGGDSIGLSSEMQPNPDLESQPQIVGALIEKVRKFGK